MYIMNYGDNARTSWKSKLKKERKAQAIKDRFDNNRYHCAGCMVKTNDIDEMDRHIIKYSKNPDNFVTFESPHVMIDTFYS